MINGYLIGLALIHTALFFGAMILSRKGCGWFGLWCGWYIPTYFVVMYLTPNTDPADTTVWVTANAWSIAFAIGISFGLSIVHIGLRDRPAPR